MPSKMTKNDIVKIASEVTGIILKKTHENTTLVDLVVEEVKSQVRIEIMLPIYNDNR